MIFLIGAAVAACELGDLETTMNEAESAFAEMSEGFETLRDAFQENVDCLQAPLGVPLAARIHKTRALYSFFDGRETDAGLELSRYRSLDPRAALDDALAPTEHPLRQIFDDATTFPEPRPLPPPDGGWLLVDGVRTGEAPQNLPFVLQHVLDGGSVEMTFLVEVGAELPGYRRAPSTAVPMPPSPPQPATGRKEARLPALALTGVAMAVVGAGLYGGAFATRGAYERAKDDADIPAIKRNHALTNTLTVSGLVLVGSGGALVVAGQF